MNEPEIDVRQELPPNGKTPAEIVAMVIAGDLESMTLTNHGGRLSCEVVFVSSLGGGKLKPSPGGNEPWIGDPTPAIRVNQRLGDDGIARSRSYERGGRTNRQRDERMREGPSPGIGDTIKAGSRVQWQTRAGPNGRWKHDGEYLERDDFTHVGRATGARRVLGGMYLVGVLEEGAEHRVEWVPLEALYVL